MSRGRPTVGLEDLQDLLQTAYGVGRLEQAVATAVGRKPLVNVTVEALQSANLPGGSQGMARPTDDQYGMSRGDFRREVREMVKTRRPEWAEVVDMVLSDREPPEGMYVREHVVAGIQILAAQCAKDLRATLAPERPPKAPKTAKMPVRTRGHASPVVVRDAGGQYLDEHGQVLSRFDVAQMRTVADPYGTPPWEPRK